MPSEVQMRTRSGEWVNACCYDEGDGIRNEVFDTHEEAQAVLDELLVLIADDVAGGICPPWTRADFRIHDHPTH